MVNKHTVVYHPSPSELTSRIHPPHIGLVRGLSLHNISFLKTVCLTMVAEKFQIHGVKITRKYISESKKTESVHFHSCSQAKVSPRSLSSPLLAEEITHFFGIMFSKDLFFPSRKGIGLWS